MSWDAPLVSLGDLRYFKSINGLWTGKKPPLVQAGVIRNTNFTGNGRVDYTDVAYIDVEERQLASRRLEPRDVIIERSGGGPKQPVGRVVYFDRDGETFSFSNFTSAIRVVDRLSFEPRFVFYTLLDLYQSGHTEEIQSHTTGIRNLDFAAYKERAKLPLIPLTEQLKIAKILDTVQRAMEQHERLVATTIELKSTLMHNLFTAGCHGVTQESPDLGFVPNGWLVEPLGKVARLKSGGTPSRKSPEYWDGGTIPWVKTGEVDYCLIRDTEEKITPQGLANSSATLFPPGTVLMAMYGQGVTRGKVAVLGIEAATNQACVAIFSCDSIRPRFLYYFLESKYEFIRNLGHGANQKNLSAEILKSMPIAFSTDLAEQDTIVEALETLDRKLDVTQRKRALLNDLFRTLLHQLITGQIRVTDLDLSALTDPAEEEVAIPA